MIFNIENINTKEASQYNIASTIMRKRWWSFMKYKPHSTKEEKKCLLKCIVKVIMCLSKSYQRISRWYITMWLDTFYFAEAIFEKSDHLLLLTLLNNQRKWGCNIFHTKFISILLINFHFYLSHRDGHFNLVYKIQTIILR